MRFAIILAALAACSSTDKDPVPERRWEDEWRQGTTMRDTTPGEVQFLLEGELDGEGRVSLAVLPYGETVPTMSYAGGAYAPVKLVLDGTFAGALWYTLDTGGAGGWNREGAVLPSGWEGWSITNGETGSQSLGVIAPDTVVGTIEVWDMGG